MSSETKSSLGGRDPRFRALDELIRAPHPRRRYSDALPQGFVGHSTRESFTLAVAPPQLRCVFCPGFADAQDHAKGCPRFETVSAAVANAGIAAAYARYEPPQINRNYQPAETADERSARLYPRDLQDPEDPALASDAEIRACSRLAAAAGVVQ